MDIETSYRTSRRQGKGPVSPFTLILLVVFMLGLGTSVVMWWMEKVPSKEKAEPFSGQSNPAGYQDEILPKETVIIVGKEALVAVSFLKEKIDPEIHWDEKSKAIIITTKDKVLRFPDQGVQAFVNEKPFSLQVSVQEKNGELYVPFQPLEKIYPYQLQTFTETGFHYFRKSGDMIQQGKTVEVEGERETVYFLRQTPSIKAPYVYEIKQGETIEIYKEVDGWYLILTEKGYMGFVEKKDVVLTDIKQLEWKHDEKEYLPWNPIGGKINLTWEHVHTKNPDYQKISPMPGLNVVSPTWFQLQNGAGDIASKASLSYVDWSHQQGYQVWGLFSNNFDPDITTQALSSYENRKKMIKQLLQYASMYKLDGVNLDFENVYLKDKDNLVQFVRELTPYLHEQNLVVSMDVTIKSNSENWSLFYDRARLAQTVDYMMVMTYDEHWAASPIAGSVASLPWVEKGLQGILEEVPGSKLLLGVPYYTRLWKEEKGTDGKVKVTSKALSMDTANKWIEERNLNPAYNQETGQNYVEYFDSKENVTYKMWMEDETSINKRAELVLKYNLAGIASWRRGFETPTIWQAIENGLKNKP